jgi:hypothetical protein
VSDGALAPTGHNPLALPTTTAGARLTLAGSATSEGALALSGDGRYVTLAGYDAAPGTAGVAGTSTTGATRSTAVAGRIDASGTIDTSTKTTMISGGNPRSAVTNDGNGFWLGGSVNGVVYVPFGTTGGTALLASPTNVRWVDIFGTQLYGTSGSGAFVNVFTIGTNLPITAGQTATSLPGMPITAGPSPYGYAFVGANVLYVADDRAPPNGGVQKWTLSAGTWTLKTTFTTGTTGARGVAAFVTGSTTTVVATTAGSSSTAIDTLVVYVDDGVNLTPTAKLLATAGTSTTFRGVAPSPR